MERLHEALGVGGGNLGHLGLAGPAQSKAAGVQRWGLPLLNTWEGSPPAMATESLPTLAAPPYSYCPRPPILCAWPGWHRAPSPLEQEEVDVVVALGEEVAEDPSWVAAADLVGGQPDRKSVV